MKKGIIRIVKCLGRVMFGAMILGLASVVVEVGAGIVSKTVVLPVILALPESKVIRLGS